MSGSTSAQTDQAITDLTTDVASLTTVVASAEAAFSGLAAQLAAAIANATNQGATPAQLQGLTDLHTSLSAKISELAAAIPVNTPAATP